MIVHGFSFYANHEGLFKDAYPVTCKIFRKGGNQLPTGQPLATSTVFINKFIVDTNYSDTTRYTAIFNTPVAIQFDYILTIEYDSTVPIHIGVSDWIAGDGDKDRLAIGKINDTTWVSSSSNAVFNCEGADCDMDVIIEPLIEFNLDANFFYDFECMDMDQQPVVLYDNSSQIIRSKIYNTRAFYTSSVKAFEWDFDDGSPILNLIDPQHSFVGDGPFDVTLTIFMDGWTIACNNSQTLNIPAHPVGKYGYEQLTSQVTFTDSSSNVDEYLWIFSDNTISTLRNPVHYFTEIGRFEVCQYVSNVCGSDTNCDSITVNVVGITENYAKDFHIYPNPARDYLSVSASFDLMDEFRIDMLDLSGRLVKSLILTGASSNGQLYVGDLARGTYLLKIKADEFEGMKKIILTE